MAEISERFPSVAFVCSILIFNALLSAFAILLCLAGICGAMETDALRELATGLVRLLDRNPAKRSSSAASAANLWSGPKALLPGLLPWAHRLLVVGAHPDDETLGAGALLSAWSAAGGETSVAILTNGVPDERAYFPDDWDGSAAGYRQTRRREAAEALALLGVAVERQYYSAIGDLRLLDQLHTAALWMARIMDQARPDLLLVPAWEGGHPDHDAAHLLAVTVAREDRRRPGVPQIWEYPLYSVASGAVIYGRFGSAPTAAGVELEAGGAWEPHQARKRAALARYRSQTTTLRSFPAGERMRRLPRYDYTRPPAARCVYELWGWPWDGEKVAHRCGQWLRHWRMEQRVRPLATPLPKSA